jgi:hypothetical protein
MNELIKQAAEDNNMHEIIKATALRMAQNGTLDSFPLGEVGKANFIIDKLSIVLTVLKEKGFELVNIEDRTVQNLMTELKYPTCNSYDIEAKLAEAISIGENRGAAKERERMEKFAEWASGEGWEYVGGTAQSWLRWADDNVENAIESKTTSELIEIFNTQNKEG